MWLKPSGKITAARNNDGINHYLNVLNALKNAGVDVALTMWHWDTPQALENYAYSNPACRVAGAKTGSFWLCPDSDVFFKEYAQLLVGEFAGLAKYWITLNEPLTVIQNGYAGGAPHAPGRCSDRQKCWDGNDAVEPFVAAHNLLRAHAEAFNVHKVVTVLRRVLWLFWRRPLRCAARVQAAVVLTFYRDTTVLCRYGAFKGAHWWILAPTNMPFLLVPDA